jgi:hypothetical protein
VNQLRTTAEFEDTLGVFRDVWGGVIGPSDLLAGGKERTSFEKAALEVLLCSWFVRELNLLCCY